MPSIIQRLKSHLFAEVINGKRYVCGMLEHVEDERDIQYGWIFGTPAYVPKNRVVDILPVSVKDQNPYNNCTFQSAIGQKEQDEGVELSARHLTAEAVKRGRVSGDGFSTLRNAQQTLVDTGACEQAFMPEILSDFGTYADASKITYCAQMNAELHKNKGFVSVMSKDEILHALDTGRTVQVGMNWYSGYNMSGGLTAPYILTIGKGYKVGGHAVRIRGFDLDKGLYKVQNSYGLFYGDNGCFYVRIDDWHSKVGGIGYCGVDADYLNPASKAYEGMDVKADSNPRIYRIEGGKKRWYPDEKTFYFWGGKFQPPSYQRISGTLLNAIADGEPMSTNVKFVADIGKT